MSDQHGRPPDERPDRGSSEGGKPSDDKPGGGRPQGDKPEGGKPYGDKPSGGKPYGDQQRGSGPYRGKPGGGRPYGNKPGGGRPYGGKPSGGRPYGNKSGGSGPYRGKPGGGRPYGNKPGGGRPYDDRPDGPRPYNDRSGGPRGHDRRDDRAGRSGPGGPPDRGRFDDERRQGPPRRDQQGPPRPQRHFEHSHRDRGPRPPRGPWDRDRGPRRAHGDWDRPPRSGPPRPPGPTAAEILGEDEEVVAGRRPVEEAFAARREAVRLLVVPERRSALEQLVLHATTLRIPVVEVEGGTITAVTGFDGHQGIALVVTPRRWATLDEVLALAKSRGEPPFLLALDHLEDPQNVGTLLRSAEACGVHGVVFPTRGAAPISPAAIKTSAGAVEHLLLVPMPDLAGALVDLHARGVRVIGADGDASMTVREADLRGPVVIVTGSEGRGLNARVRKRVDLMARIPMRGKVASLNASVAGSVFLFEAASQRDLPEAEPGASVFEAEAGEPAESEAPEAQEVESAATPEAEAPEVEASTIEPEASSDATPAPAADGVADDDDLLPEVPPSPSPEGTA